MNGFKYFFYMKNYLENHIMLFLKLNVMINFKYLLQKAK